MAMNHKTILNLPRGSGKEDNMSKIMITGATGELGGLTLEHLLNMKNISKEQVAVLARKKNENLFNKGIEIRIGSYDDRESLDKAFEGIEKLLIVSSPALNNAQRLEHQFNAVMAAEKNNVQHIVYVGVANPEKRSFALEDVDMATEHMIQAIGVPYTVMRNPVYLDTLKYDFQLALKTGRLLSATQDKAFNYVLKSDLALANATVLCQDGHQNKIYDLSSHELITYSEIAKILSQITGKTIAYEEKSAEEVIANMVDASIDKEAAEMLVNSFQLLIAENQFTETSTDLKKLIGEKLSSKKNSIIALLDMAKA